MTDVVGGDAGRSTLDAMAAATWDEPWYRTDRGRANSFGLRSRHHGAKDPGGHAFWRSGDRFGALQGVVTNRRALGLSEAELFERVLEAPHATLPRLDGPFCIVCCDGDADRIVLAVDKLGARQWHYTADDPFRFGTSVSPLLVDIDRPQVDLRGVSDLLLIGQVWGDRTLVEEVRTLPTGCVLEYENGERTVSRYRTFDFGRSAPKGYASELARRYRRAVGETAETVEGSLGLWLSGGLDSRALGTVLADRGDLSNTFTYDSRPVGRDPPIARRVACEWDVSNTPVSLTPDRVLDRIDDGIALTDGLIPWPSFLNLSTVFQIGDAADVVAEACGQGVLLGSGIWQPDAEGGRSAAEILYRGEHWLDAESVRDLMPVGLDPMATYREATDPDGSTTSDPGGLGSSGLGSSRLGSGGFGRSELEVGTVGGSGVDRTGDGRTGGDDLSRALAGLHRYYFQRGDFVSNRIARSQVGTRVPYANEALLSHVERMPYAYRERTVPFTRGVIPYGCAPLKLDLVRRLADRTNDRLATIPYERSGLAPRHPLGCHAAGFVCTTVADRLRSRPTYGGVSIGGAWYREHEEFRTYVDDLLAAACERPFFDGAELRRRRRAHLAGKRDEIQAIAAVTTVERWLGAHVDASPRDRVPVGHRA